MMLNDIPRPTTQWESFVIQFAGDHHIVNCHVGHVDITHDQPSGETVIRMNEIDAGRILSTLLANWHRLHQDHR